MHWQNPTIGLLICSLLYVSVLCIQQSYDMTIEKINFNVVPSYNIIDSSNLFLMGRNRVINGSVVLLEDIGDEHFEVSLELFSDPIGTGEFRPLPYNISRMGPCNAVREYKSYASPTLVQGVNTNFPVDEDVCPIPKGVYYFHDIEVQTDNFPNQVARGFFKAVFAMFKDGKYVGEFEILCRIEDK